ncbi:MAG: hypothetical protein H3C43_09280 [Leptonema sp. (in: Bacteria)]|nr:hypothetical protein [Leptonema sp. (in: bacteria)]
MPEILSDPSTEPVNVSVEYLLFPELVTRQRKVLESPSLAELRTRVEAVKERIEARLQSQVAAYEHPLSICFFLAQFQEKYLQIEAVSSSVGKAARFVIDQKKIAAETRARKRKSKKSAQKKTIENENLTITTEPVTTEQLTEDRKKQLRSLHRMIQSIKSKLEIESKLRSASTEQLQFEMARQLNKISAEFVTDQSDQSLLLAEIERYRNPDFMHPHHRLAFEQAVSELEHLRREFRRERKRGDLLESEVRRLTEQIIEGPSPSVRNEQLHELESLRRDYQLISQKYDMLVTKNIELSNRLEDHSHVKSLEQALDKVRDRINAAIRTDDLTNEMLIVRIRREIEQLQRARIYLGKAVFDLGMLYLRLGRKEDAIAELRAAKELGVNDPEANRFIENQTDR